MSQAHSISTHRRYGLARVCDIWGASRATVYRQRAPGNAANEPSAASPWPGRGLQRQRASGAYPSHHRSLALFREGVPGDLGTVASARHSYRPPSGEADHEGKRPSGAAAARPAGRASP